MSLMNFISSTVIVTDNYVFFYKLSKESFYLNFVNRCQGHQQAIIFLWNVKPYWSYRILMMNDLRQYLFFF